MNVFISKFMSRNNNVEKIIYEPQGRIKYLEVISYFQSVRVV